MPAQFVPNTGAEIGALSQRFNTAAVALVNADVAALHSVVILTPCGFPLMLRTFTDKTDTTSSKPHPPERRLPRNLNSFDPSAARIGDT